MRYSVTMGDQAAELDVAPLDDEGMSRVTIDEDAHRVAIRPALPHQLQLSLSADEQPLGDARQQTAFVARSKDGLWVWTAGRARLVRPQQERRRTGGSSGAGVGQSVTPPMPSVVTKVLVELGQTVDRGEALVVVSAMKMEMTLTSPHAGTVRAIHTEEGAKANPGDVLVEVEPTTEPQASAP